MSSRPPVRLAARRNTFPHPGSLQRLGAGAGTWLMVAGVSCWLVGCSTPGNAPTSRPGSVATEATPPARPPRRGADGPPAGPVPDLSALANAEPRVEPIRSGGPNKPYEVQGQGYVPLVGDQPLVERGMASWYGQKFHGRRTASGETYNMLAMTAAHKTMPIPSYARVRNPANGREIIVRVNDRGPFSPNRVIDLSYAAAVKLGLEGGVATVEVERITHDEIRAGLPRREGDLLADPGAMAAAEPAWRSGAPVATAATASGVSEAPPAAAPAALTGQALDMPAAASTRGSPGVTIAQAEPRRAPTPAATGRAPSRGAAPAPAGATPSSVPAVVADLPAAAAPSASPAATPAMAATAATAAAAGAQPSRVMPSTVPAGPAAPSSETAPVVAAALATPGAQLPGTAPERGRAFTPAASGFWLQLGAFARGDGAYTFQQRVAQELGWLSPLLTVFAEGSLHRLQAGPYASKDQAREVAERVRSSLQLVPVIVERR